MRPRQTPEGLPYVTEAELIAHGAIDPSPADEGPCMTCGHESKHHWVGETTGCEGETEECSCPKYVPDLGAEYRRKMNADFVLTPEDEDKVTDLLLGGDK